MSIKELKEAQEKEEKRLLKLGDSYEKKLKEYEFQEEDDYLVLRDRMRLRVNVFLSLCFINALIISIAFVFYLKPTSVALYTTSYSAENELIQFLPSKDTDDGYGHKILFDTDAETGEQRVLVVDKRDL